MPSFLLNGRFLARFRDDDTVLVVQLAMISERDVLMELDPRAFFFTEHYRNYPAVLVRLTEVARPLLIDVVTEAWRYVASLPPPRPRKKPGRGRKRRERSRGPAPAQQTPEACRRLFGLAGTECLSPFGGPTA